MKRESQSKLVFRRMWGWKGESALPQTSSVTPLLPAKLGGSAKSGHWQVQILDKVQM